MRKMYLALGTIALLLLLLVGAFAFSLTLQNLRVNALSFAQPAAAASIAAPMTFADEAEISSPATDGVRLEEFQAPKGFCQKNKGHDRATDF